MNSSFASLLLFAALTSAILVAACGDDEVSPSPADEQPSVPGLDSSSTTTAKESATSTQAPTVTTTAVPTVGGGGPDAPDNTPLVACGNILVPLDKGHRLSADCAPGDLVGVGNGELLRSEAAAHYQAMVSAATSDGFTLIAASGYRSYATQVSVFWGHVARSGLIYAERTSARPGHSEHQLGTTMDVQSPSQSFEGFVGSPEAAWVAANAWRFGFVVSYPDGKEQITGYAFEPWHVRFVGLDVARKVRDSGLTLHEFLLR